MIPRTLVPVDVRPVSKDELRKPGRRLTTYMDDRTVVPSELSDAPPLDGKSTIPTHLPLGVLVDRTLVPRGMAVKPMERYERFGDNVSIAVLDERMVVPVYVEPLTKEERETPEQAPEMTAELLEIVQPDIFTTGDANLLIEREEKKDAKEDLVTRILSVLVHIGLIAFVIFVPKIFPAPKVTEIGKDNLDTHWMYSPPPSAEPAKPAPKVPISRETIRKVAPPVERPAVTPPAPERPAPELPEAPRPKNMAVTPTPPAAVPTTPAPSRLEPVLPVTPKNAPNLGLSPSSPGRMLDDQISNAVKGAPRQSPGYSPMPGGGGGHGPGAGAGYEILSDTQGVDFSAYIRRLLATLQRNWEAIMPESVRMGEQGVVYTVFSVNPDGSVSAPDPQLERTSGKEPLDNAAMGAIHASNPFEPLPSQFHGPYLKLRIVFLYNVKPEQVGLH